jgi:hypothetical protein
MIRDITLSRYLRDDAVVARCRADNTGKEPAVKEISSHPAYQFTEDGPTVEECTLALAKAVAVRRERARNDPQHAALTTSQIAAHGSGITDHSRRGVDEWWLVGRVRDELEGADFSVWYFPGHRRIGISARRVGTIGHG